MNKNFSTNRGFIKTVLIILAALVFLKYIYRIDVVGFLTQGRSREFLDQFYKWGAEGWNKYQEVIIGVRDYAFSILKDLWEKFKR